MPWPGAVAVEAGNMEKIAHVVLGYADGVVRHRDQPLGLPLLDVDHAVRAPGRASGT